MNIRNATKDDAVDLASLINLAGEGLPMLMWRQKAAPGQNPLNVGAIRAAREDSSFSYRNARVVEIDGAIAGMLLGYLLPDPYDGGALTDYPAIVRPLIELEAEAPGSWYINAIATYESFRGRGVASALMRTALETARAEGARWLSLIVASENTKAHALYSRLGYEVAASRPVTRFQGGPQEGQWLLMIHQLP